MENPSVGVNQICDTPDCLLHNKETQKDFLKISSEAENTGSIPGSCIATAICLTLNNCSVNRLGRFRKMKKSVKNSKEKEVAITRSCEPHKSQSSVSQHPATLAGSYTAPKQE